mmetsp:Transcript_9206/g.9277  ORF Transcript_9206/g.9277 Transcript_9206/m.9277 type:complete len:628 (+) Transcript_9206:7-1890(+)
MRLYYSDIFIKKSRSNVLLRKLMSLDQFQKSSIVLYKSKNYLVINKPPDVRMNGDFDVTVEKLVTHMFPELSVADLKWVHQLDFPTSGVLCIGLHKDAGYLASSAFELRSTRKQYIAVLQGHLQISQWPLLNDPPIQTSDPFHDNLEGGSVFKREYADVADEALHKKLTPRSGNDGPETNLINNIPPINGRHSDTDREQELKYFTKRMPETQQVEMEASLLANLSALHGLATDRGIPVVVSGEDRAVMTESLPCSKRVIQNKLMRGVHRKDGDPHHGDAEERTSALRDLCGIPFAQYVSSSHLRKALKKCVRAFGVEVIVPKQSESPLEMLPDKTSEAAGEEMRRSDKVVSDTDSMKTAGDSLLKVHRIIGKRSESEKLNGEVQEAGRVGVDRNEQFTKDHAPSPSCDGGESMECIGSDDEHQSVSLVVNAPLYETKDDFVVRIGTTQTPGRSAKTYLQIEAYGWYLGEPVTKVRLFPISGRRHQLRVHCMAIGHPIVGDKTYGAHSSSQSSSDSAGSAGSTPSRMMLHAHKLGIFLPLHAGLDRSKRKRRRSREQKEKDVIVLSEIESSINAEAPDPFPMRIVPVTDPVRVDLLPLNTSTENDRIEQRDNSSSMLTLFPVLSEYVK